jgi:hypothetical protein
MKGVVTVDCPICGEPMRAAMVVCWACGLRATHPADGSGNAADFDRSHWDPLPPFQTSNEPEFSSVGIGNAFTGIFDLLDLAGCLIELLLGLVVD